MAFLGNHRFPDKKKEDIGEPIGEQVVLTISSSLVRAEGTSRTAQ